MNNKDKNLLRLKKLFGLTYKQMQVYGKVDRYALSIIAKNGNDEGLANKIYKEFKRDILSKFKQWEYK